jgi:hypothetical protein
MKNEVDSVNPWLGPDNRIDPKRILLAGTTEAVLVLASMAVTYLLLNNTVEPRVAAAMIPANGMGTAAGTTIIMLKWANSVLHK